ncbi:MAG: lysoplasmalogenase [Myxococcota bacterium]
MGAAAPFVILTAIGALGLLFAEFKKNRTLVWGAKPMAAIGFVLTALAASAGSRSSAGQVVVLGLILAAIGDVLLIPKEDKRFFLAGLLSFLLGHLAYLASFLMRGVNPIASCLALSVLTIPAAIVLRWLLPKAGKLKIPVIAYVTVISAMVGAAMGMVWAGGDPKILVAAVCFYLSDLGVARERFVSSSFTNKAFGHPLYFGAQILFALYASG